MGINYLLLFVLDFISWTHFGKCRTFSKMSDISIFDLKIDIFDVFQFLFLLVLKGGGGEEEESARGRGECARGCGV